MSSKISVQIQKNTLLRKSHWLIRQTSRRRDSYHASLEDYKGRRPVFVNSFPKSGTHLLLQILQAVPWTTYYSSFLASMPPTPHRERSQQSHIKRLRQIAPGEIMPGHLFYHPDYHKELVQHFAILFFIYRDPRDVAISEAHFLTFMAHRHGLHDYFAKKLTTMEDRISACIMGVTEPGFPYSYPDIAQRFERYKKWLYCPDVFDVKFEDLVGEQRDIAIKRIAEYVAAQGDPSLDVELLTRDLSANIAPQDSRTFRKGESGQWRKTFSETQKEQFKSVAGDLLIELGYEKEFTW